MRKLVVLIALLGLFSLPLMAQDTPKAEVFGGYQYTHITINTTVAGTSINKGFNFNGWNASVTGNFNKYFGVAADFSGDYKSISGVNTNIYTYTFGPVVSLNHEGTVNPFVHALFGGVHAGAGQSGVGVSSNGFAMLAGGGVDAKVAPHIAVRLAQFDWFYYHVQGLSESKNVRISTGIVFRF